MQASAFTPVPNKPTLAQVRALARQLSAANRRKLLTELFAADVERDVREIQAIGQAVQAQTQAQGMPPITDEDLDRELKEFRQQRVA